MRIEGGYGKKTVERNIKEYIAHGYSPEKAGELARNIARKFFKKRYPGTKVPEYLI